MSGLLKTSNFFNKAFQVLIKHKPWVMLLAIVLILKVFTPVTFLVLAYACILYLFFYPITAWLQSVLRTNTMVTIIIFILSFITLLGLAGAFLIPALINQILEFSNNYPQIQTTVIAQLSAWQNSLNGVQAEFFKATHISTDAIFAKYIQQLGQAIIIFFEKILDSLSIVLATLLNIFIAFIVSLYVLFERKTIVTFFKNHFQKKASVREKKFLSLAYAQIMAYFSGLLLLSFICFIVTWLFLSIIGLKFALLFGLWTGIMNFIPVFGPLLAIIPIIIVAWTQATEMFLAVAIFFLILQILLSYILAPIILGNKSQLSPLMILITMLLGAELYGILGMVLAIPLTSLCLLIWQVYTNKL